MDGQTDKMKQAISKKFNLQKVFKLLLGKNT